MYLYYYICPINLYDHIIMTCFKTYYDNIHMIP